MFFEWNLFNFIILGYMSIKFYNNQDIVFADKSFL